MAGGICDPSLGAFIVLLGIRPDLLGYIYHERLHSSVPQSIREYLLASHSNVRQPTKTQSQLQRFQMGRRLTTVCSTSGIAFSWESALGTAAGSITDPPLASASWFSNERLQRGLLDSLDRFGSTLKVCSG